MSAVLRNQSVTVRKATGWTIRLGERVATFAEATHDVSVQPALPARTEEFGDEGSVGAFSVYFFDADPGVDAGDEVAWGARTLAVLGPAQDQAGRGRVFKVPCREVR